LTLSLAPKRIFAPIRMLHQIGRHRSDRTQPTMIEWRLAVSLDLYQNAVSDVHQYSASAVATAANALENDVSPLSAAL